MRKKLLIVISVSRGANFLERSYFTVFCSFVLMMAQLSGKKTDTPVLETDPCTAYPQYDDEMSILMLLSTALLSLGVFRGRQYSRNFRGYPQNMDICLFFIELSPNQEEIVQNNIIWAFRKVCTGCALSEAFLPIPLIFMP